MKKRFLFLAFIILTFFDQSVSHPAFNNIGYPLPVLKERQWGNTKEINTPSVLIASIPFEVRNGAIVLTVKLNGFTRALHFLFDTGADGMAINASIADSAGLKISREQNAMVVGGSKRISLSDNNTLYLDTFQIKNQTIAIFDEIGSFDGIIGNVIARDHIVKADYDRKVLEFYSFGDYQYEKEGISIPIDLSSRVPVLPLDLKIGEKEVRGNFVFDTGADYYLITFGPFGRKNLLLTNGFVPWFSAATVSMGHSSPTFTGIFQKVSFGNIAFNDFPGTIKAFTAADDQSNMPEDGSLGIRIISRFNFTLNFAEKIIHFTPNKSWNAPIDFMLGKWYMAFTDKREILVKFYSLNNADQQDLKAGDIIVSINDIKAKDLYDQPEKIKKLQNINPEKLKYIVLRNGVMMKI